MSALVLARCEGVRPETGDVKVITLRVEGAHAHFLDTVLPGGHVAVRYPDGTGQLQQRLYSVTRVEEPNLFEIAVRRASYNGVSDRLHSDVREGVIIPLAITDAPRARLLLAETGRMLGVAPGKSILEILDDYGVPLRSGCRSGICGGCRIRIVGGECRVEADSSLNNAERANGYALACCVFPISGDVVIAVGAALRA
ncbi:MULTISPECIES: 2Fe-2S iron-sulfur cluster-binding protein [unclassified Xanthobacter]|uniref:2Fe-2S iron-sulfur cluster-binding protein n=1 Tax=unclassified Xanthobacter TaxID=2623496 RepID=UPI001F18BFD0|nr:MULTISPECIES: 2Fe-2S iron-sulfur cluster-binding protein [unclassified Xanthobacter]